MQYTQRQLKAVRRNKFKARHKKRAKEYYDAMRHFAYVPLMSKEEYLDLYTQDVMSLH